MSNSNEIKTQQLGIPVGTASAILRKNILFNYIVRCKDNICFQCGNTIESVDDLSIEHKIPYLHSENPIELFFSIDNIAFSHLSCNIRAGRKHYSACGTKRKYELGCRCSICTKANTLHVSSYRKRKNGRLV